MRHLSQRMPEQAAAELQPLVAAFNQMLSRLERGYQQLSQVSADMAHDLRTPISTLIGQTEVALSQTRSVGDYQALLGSNYEELERLAKMIDNMLFLAKAEDASQAMDLQNIDLAQLGEKLQDYFDGMAEEQSMRLEMALSAEQQARIFDRFWRADASRHQGSSGLGLSIVRSIMRLHQGSCEVYSEQGVNRFTLRFPY